MPKKPGVKALLAFAGRFCFILRDNIPTIPYPNTWNLPGGGMEDGETPEQAMRRELEEELQIQPASLQSIGVTRYTDGNVVHRFFATLTEEDLEHLRLGDEGQRVGWFTPDEIPKLAMAPHLVLYLRAHQQDLSRLLREHDLFWDELLAV